MRPASRMGVGQQGHAVSTTNPMAGLPVRKDASTSPCATKLPPAQSSKQPSIGPPLWSVRLSRASLFFTQHRYLLTLAIVLFLTYMSLVNLAVNALECHDRPVGGVSYLEADLSVQCFTGRHLSVVGGAVALLLFVGAGLPLSIFVALRGAVDRPSLRFMSDGYRPGLRWWEALVLLRKMGLVLAASLVTDASSQVAAAMLVLVPSVVLHVHHKPFEQRRFNILETLSLSAMIATATLSLVFLRARGGEQAVLEGRDQEVDPALDGIVTGLLVGANGLVMVLQALVVCRAGEGSGPASAALSGCMSRRREETSRPVLSNKLGTRPSIAATLQKHSSATMAKSQASHAADESKARRGRNVAEVIPARASDKRV